VLGGSRGSMANNTLTLTLLCPANQAGLITRAQGPSSQDIINSGSKYFLSTLTPPKPHSTRRAGYLDRSREYWQRAPHLYWCVVSAWVRGISACDFSSGGQASRPAVESRVRRDSQGNIRTMRSISETEFPARELKVGLTPPLSG
jgi:hypothetical protein